MNTATAEARSSLTQTQDPAPAHDALRYTVCTTQAQREACYRLRYQVFVEEEGVQVPAAIHESRRFWEPADETSILLACFRGEEAVATMRICIGELDTLPDEPVARAARETFGGAVMASASYKYCVARSLRGSRVAHGIFLFAFEQLLRHGVRVSLLGCKEELVRYYRRYGFEPFAAAITIPGYGEITPLVLDPFDSGHLARTRSPLLGLLEKFTAEESGSQAAAA